MPFEPFLHVLFVLLTSDQWRVSVPPQMITESSDGREARVFKRQNKFLPPPKYLLFHGDICVQWKIPVGPK